MLRHLSTLLILGIILSAIYATACRPAADNGKNSTDIAKRYDWDLSDKAKTDYYYMVLEDASRSGDLAAAQDAGHPTPDFYLVTAGAPGQRLV